MSAFIVSKTHIDALVTAGIVMARGACGPMRWYWPALTDDDRKDAYERGEPWGRRAVELMTERQHELRQETAGRVGAMLWAENRRSVNHRYDEDEWEQPYEFSHLPGTPDPVIVLDAIACYEYQSCEHPEWPASEAFEFCRVLRELAIGALPRRERRWEIDDPRVFVS